MSRTGVARRPPDGNVVLISIESTSGVYPDSESIEQNGWLDFIRFRFDDITREYENLVLFSEEMAEQLYDFLLFHMNDRIIIHCDAGISRSVAIGVFLRDNFNRNILIDCGTDMFANSLVSSLLRRVHLRRTYPGEYHF